MEYKTVDVFTSKPLQGNPVAVVLDASGLTSEQMQTIARWTNLSETTFVVPTTEASADYHVRIFDPITEFPFAGHPSLGTAHALLEAGIVPRKNRLIQQCKWGLIELNVQDTRVEFGIQIEQHHSFSAGETARLREVLPGLELDMQKPPMLVYAGPRWIVAQIKGTEQDLLQYRPNLSRIDGVSTELNASGLCVFAVRSDGSNAIELRTFVEGKEDPVCGSGQAAVAFFRSLGTEYTARQGSAVKRDGNVRLRYGEGKIWVSGECVTVADGVLRVD